MFSEIIDTTPFTNTIAGGIFNNISGVNYKGDISFIATLRALVYPRMQEGEKIVLEFGSSSLRKEHIRGHNPATLIGMLKRTTFDENYIYVHNVIGEEDENISCFELLEKEFCRANIGWCRLNKITDFFRKQFKVMCFVNAKKKAVALYVENLNERRLHYLQCSIFAFLPWYFNPEEGVSEDEMELINSLREKTSGRYKNALKRLAEKYDLRSANIKNMLADFETVHERKNIEALRAKISGLIEKIERFNKEIGYALEEKRKAEVKIWGYENAMADNGGNSEIMEYFLCNKKLELFGVSDGVIKFGVKSYLTYFDEDMASRVIENNTSYVYRSGYDRYISQQEMKMLMKATFVDQILKVRVCAAYRFALTGPVDAAFHHNFDERFEEYMPNPHIDEYRCMGNYTLTINELLKDRDYIAAIEQCVASSKSLNFGDSTVAEHFIKTLYGVTGDRNKRFIELPNGEVKTPKEAIAWLKEQEVNDEQSN